MCQLPFARASRFGLTLTLTIFASYLMAHSQVRPTRSGTSKRPVNEASARLRNETPARLAKMVTIYRDKYGVPHV
ncbi:MAG TPA: hypothetical protein VFP47_18650, partial [Pyrinomonadaceae bacterium]|nr:hypothetical protein [Pyrinomonadaceae bacterium]